MGSCVSQRRNNHEAMQQEIDDLKRKLHREQQKRSPFSSDASSNEEEDVSYRWRPRTPPSETFSYEKELRLHGGMRAHLARVWVTMPWTRHWIKFPDHPSCTRLKGLNYPDVSINKRLPSTTAEQTRWSTWASLTKEWPFTPKMRLWCAKFSRPTWGQWWWDGSTAWKQIP